MLTPNTTDFVALRERASSTLPSPPPTDQYPQFSGGVNITPPSRPDDETIITTPYTFTPFATGEPNVTVNVYAELDAIFKINNDSYTETFGLRSIHNSAYLWNSPKSIVQNDYIRYVVDFRSGGGNILKNNGTIVGDSNSGSMTSVYIFGGNFNNSGQIFARTLSEGAAIGFHAAGTSTRVGSNGWETRSILSFSNTGTIAAVASGGTATGVNIEKRD